MARRGERVASTNMAIRGERVARWERVAGGEVTGPPYRRGSGSKKQLIIIYQRLNTAAIQ
jgi:hypothetical protein